MLLALCIEARMKSDLVLQWVKDHILPTGGIEAWHGYGKAYPEISGYIIPTLLKYGCREEADKLGDWLIQTQNKDGSWNGIDGKPATFDTAAIVEGLDALDRWDAAKRGREFIGSMIDKSGLIRRYPGDHERAQCYLARAAWVLGDKKAIARWLPIGSWDAAWGDVQRPHYIAYLLEGLLNAGYYASVKMVLEASVGAVDYFGYMPFYAESGWCGGGMTDNCATAQFAWLYARVGMYSQANRLGLAVDRSVKDNGGIPQSNNDDRQISWAAKYYLDFCAEANRAEVEA